MPSRVVLTIGHSNHSMADFLSLLKRHQITALADVRSAPYSRYAPHFNRTRLVQELRRYEVKYVFLGNELGGRSDDPSCYDHGRVQYARLAQTMSFCCGIGRVVKGAVSERIALMCAEKDPLNCHRTLLVAPSLIERGVDVQHISSDGSLESHHSAMLRLLDMSGPSQAGLFYNTEDLIDEAMTRQEARIAYTDKSLEQESWIAP
ncbi:MAG: DUF488 domain-containing protein [Pseudonocardiales bacterium]|nr:DUF488 domain-containing protein [Pseudonocardiales bacterium]MBV9728338.1 DUF488 domain-containing protein [Pseudonocardiales bacterium]